MKYMRIMEDIADAVTIYGKGARSAFTCRKNSKTLETGIRGDGAHSGGAYAGEDRRGGKSAV